MEEQGAACSNVTEDSVRDDKYAHIPIEEIISKIKAYITLCKTNRINATNAFDIDMIGYFLSWLKRNKSAISSNDLEMFQEISDNLEVCSKIYSCRVDNASDTTSKLVGEFRKMSNHKIDFSKRDASPKSHKYKRNRCMLTTSDKLSCKPSEREYVRPSFMRNVRNFDLNKLLRGPMAQRPSTYLISLYNNYTAQEEIDLRKKDMFIDPNQPEEWGEFDLTGLREQLEEKDIMSPELEKLMEDYAEYKPIVETELQGIEKKLNSSGTVDFKSTKFDHLFVDGVFTFPEEPKQNTIAELVKCVDGVDRPYSFFNPKLFANFKGPKAWKTQTMIKSLISCSQEEQNEVMALPVIANDLEMTAILESQITNKRKKRIGQVEISWHKNDDLEEKWNGEKGKISLRSTIDWNSIDYLTTVHDSKGVIHQINFQSNFLKMHKILQDIYSIQENVSKLKIGYEDNDDLENSILNIEITSNKSDYNTGAMDILAFKTNDDESVSKRSSSKHDYIPIELQAETKMDMFELKKKISEIIDEECVETDSDTDFTSQISFETLLLKLLAKDKEISFHIVFVALLHLTNERGLKLSQTPGTTENLYISKPITKAF